MHLIIKLIKFLEDLTLLTLRIFPAELAKNITLRLLKLIYSLNLIDLFASSNIEKSKINLNLKYDSNLFIATNLIETNTQQYADKIESKFYDSSVKDFDLIFSKVEEFKSIDLNNFKIITNSEKILSLDESNFKNINDFFTSYHFGVESKKVIIETDQFKKNAYCTLKLAEVNVYYALRTSGSVQTANVKQKYIITARSLLNKHDYDEYADEKNRLEEMLDSVDGQKADQWGSSSGGTMFNQFDETPNRNVTSSSGCGSAFIQIITWVSAIIIAAAYVFA